MLEKDLEDWIYNNPQDFFEKRYMVFDRWIGRQVRLGNGVADLVAQVNCTGDRLRIIVIELKKDEITDSALAQVMRYKNSILHALETKLDVYPVKDQTVWAMVCGSSINTKTLASAHAMEIDVRLFKNEFSFNGVQFTDNYQKEREEKNKKFISTGELDEIINAQIKEYEEWHQKNGRM